MVSAWRSFTSAHSAIGWKWKQWLPGLPTQLQSWAYFFQSVSQTMQMRCLLMQPWHACARAGILKGPIHLLSSVREEPSYTGFPALPMSGCLVAAVLFPGVHRSPWEGPWPSCLILAAVMCLSWECCCEPLGSEISPAAQAAVPIAPSWPLPLGLQR